MRAAIAIVGLLLAMLWVPGSPTTARRKGLVWDALPQNITTNLANWEMDQAIMFYAPWCKFCKQLSPSWDVIASLVSNRPDLAIAKVDCEATKAHKQICLDLGIAFYPTVLFFGYGDFHQVRERTTLDSPSIVRFGADLYAEALHDWIRMLHAVSTWKRRWENLKAVFTGKVVALHRLDNMAQRLHAAERKAELFSKELQKLKADELFDSIEDQGDIFPLLHDLAPDQQNLPLRACVADLAGEFCKYYSDEEYCQVLDRCLQEEMEPQACRPAKCPFQEPRGCVVTSSCLRKDVIVEYKKRVEEYAA